MKTRRNDRFKLSYQWNLYNISRRFQRALTFIGAVFDAMVNPLTYNGLSMLIDECF